MQFLDPGLHVVREGVEFLIFHVLIGNEALQGLVNLAEALTQDFLRRCGSTSPPC